MIASIIETFKTFEQQQQALGTVQQVVEQIMAVQKRHRAAPTKSAQNAQNQFGITGKSHLADCEPAYLGSGGPVFWNWLDHNWFAE